MSTLDLPQCNAMFLHIPKTAGHSVTVGLKESLPGFLAYPTRHMRKAYGAAKFITRTTRSDILARRWSFCFVRNPWDWAVSGWKHVTENKGAYGDNPPDFKTFVTGDWQSGLVFNPHKLKFKTPKGFVEYHCKITQMEHLRLGLRGQLAPIAFYGRFEHLQQDWERICDRLGKEILLPHKNKSSRDDYTAYYNDDLRRIVADKNADLIERFKYQFGA